MKESSLLRTLFAVHGLWCIPCYTGAAGSLNLSAQITFIALCHRAWFSQHRVTYRQEE